MWNIVSTEIKSPEKNEPLGNYFNYNYSEAIKINKTTKEILICDDNYHFIVNHNKTTSSSFSAEVIT